MKEQNYNDMPKENTDTGLDINSILYRLGKNSQDDPVNILKLYNVSAWGDWIDDILNFGFANPISSLTRDGDVLVDIVDYLRDRSISLNNYEEAITILVNQFDVNHSDAIILERLLNVLINIRGKNSTDILIKLVVSRENNFIRGRFHFVKSLALLALAKAVIIDDSKAIETYNYLRMVGLTEMQHDPVFYGNSLRFCYQHLPIEHFFELLTHIFDLLESNEVLKGNPNFLINRHIVVILDKFEELHYQDIGKFYSELFNWLSRILISEKYRVNSIFIMAMNSFFDKMFEYPYRHEMFLIKQKKQSDIFEKKLFHEYEYALLVRVSLAIFTNSRNNILSSYQILHSIAFLAVVQPKKIQSFKNLLVKNGSYLRSNYDILPYIAFSELRNEFNSETIDIVSDVVSEAFYSSEITLDEQIQKQEEISSFFCDLVDSEDKLLKTLEAI